MKKTRVVRDTDDHVQECHVPRSGLESGDYIVLAMRWVQALLGEIGLRMRFFDFSAAGISIVIRKSLL